MLVGFGVLVLGDFNLFRCDGSFWLLALFVRYLTWKIFFIGARMYLQDRFYPRVFIGGIDGLIWFRLLVDFVLFSWGSWDCWRVARVRYWFGGFPVELGVALVFVGLVYVFFAFGLGKSVKSCIGFSSRCFYFVGIEFDVASLSAFIYITCSSSTPWVGGFV